MVTDEGFETCFEAFKAQAKLFKLPGLIRERLIEFFDEMFLIGGAHLELVQPAF